jgi:uncharacterized membrane protein YraQ (UPF0718 family)
MEFILNGAITSIGQVWVSLLHNWPYLAMSVVIVALLKLYVDAEKVSAFLSRYRGASVVGATAAAVATPLCSCGTTAVILGMVASNMPWAPIIAFMVASPLTSPEGLVYSAGLFGWPFALAFYLASIVLGLVGGWVAAVFESRGWLAGQTRFAEEVSAPCACAADAETSITTGHAFSLEMPSIQLSALAASCGCGQPEEIHAFEELRGNSAENSSGRAESTSLDGTQKPQATLAMFVNELYRSGKQLLVMFVGFAFIETSRAGNHAVSTAVEEANSGA